MYMRLRHISANQKGFHGRVWAWPGLLLLLLRPGPLFHQLRSNIDLQTSILRTEIVWTHLRTLLIKMSLWEPSARRAQAVQSNRRRRANDCVCIAFMSNLCLFKWPLLLFTHSRRGDFSALPRAMIFFISEPLPSGFPQNPMRLDSPSDNEELYKTTLYFFLHCEAQLDSDFISGFSCFGWGLGRGGSANQHCK